MNLTLKLPAALALILAACPPTTVLRAKFFDVRQFAAATDAAQPVTANTPVCRDIQIINLMASGPKSAGFVAGLSELCISNMVFENVEIFTATGLTIRNAKGVQFKNSLITVEKGAPFTAENAEVTGLEEAKG